MQGREKTDLWTTPCNVFCQVLERWHSVNSYFADLPFNNQNDNIRKPVVNFQNNLEKIEIIELLDFTLTRPGHEEYYPWIKFQLNTIYEKMYFLMESWQFYRNSFRFLASNLGCLKIKLWTNVILSNKRATFLLCWNWHWET